MRKKQNQQKVGLGLLIKIIYESLRVNYSLFKLIDKYKINKTIIYFINNNKISIKIINYLICHK